MEAFEELLHTFPFITFEKVRYMHHEYTYGKRNPIFLNKLRIGTFLTPNKEMKMDFEDLAQQPGSSSNSVPLDDDFQLYMLQTIFQMIRGSGEAAQEAISSASHALDELRKSSMNPAYIDMMSCGHALLHK